jgi:hypothetical protein
MDKLKPYMKAVAAFLVPFAGQVVAAMQDGSQGGSTITSQEWLTAVLTSIVASGAVFTVPNKDPLGIKQDESVQPPERVQDVVDAALNQPIRDEGI